MKNKNARENRGPRQFREVDKSTGREQPVTDSLKLGDTVRAAERAGKGSEMNIKKHHGPFGESYDSLEEALNAKQRHVSQMIDDKHAGQAAKDALKNPIEGLAARVETTQRLKNETNPPQPKK